MKKYFLFFLTALFLITIHSCAQDEIINKKHDEVMLIHDEVMPKMKNIHALKKKLKAKEGDTTAQALILKLDQADEAMMEWMAAYHKPSVSDTSAMSYLADQLDKIKDVKLLMESEIENAKAYIND